MALSGKRIFITGGAGFIGTTIARLLVDDNEIVAFDNLHRDALTGTDLAEHPNLTFVQGDVLDAEAVTRAAEGATHIVHCAAIAGVDTVLESPVRTMRVNMIGTSNVLEAAIATQGLERLVEFSTSEVFGTYAFRVAETSVTTIGSVGEARWTYAVSKLAGEHMAHAYHGELGLPTVSVRPVQRLRARTGRRRRDSRLHRGRARGSRPDRSTATARRSAPGATSTTWSTAILLCLEHPEQSARASTSATRGRPSRSTTWRQRITRLAGAPGEIVFPRNDYEDVELRIPYVDKARELLGFEAKVELDDGLERTIAWYRESS